jgi:hypothetical protein
MRRLASFIIITFFLAPLVGCDDNAIVPAAAPDTVRVSFQDGVLPTASYSGTADAVIKDGPNSAMNNGNFGAAPSDTLGSAAISAGFRERRLIIRTDLSSITSCSQVLSADLSLRIIPPAAGGMTLAAHLTVLSAWKQWVEGTGGPANGVSWTTIDGTDPWGVPGGDFEGAAFDQEAILVDSVVVFALPTAAVRNWILAPASNHGIIIRTTDPSLERYAIVCLREYGRADWRPRLDITYIEGG